MTKAEALEAAKTDYANALGTVIRADAVYGYRNDNQVEYYTETPIRVRVIGGELEHFNDDYLDPYWDVELVEVPAELQGVSSTWIDGPSYKVDADKQRRKA